MAIIIIFLSGISTVSKNRHKISLFRVLFKILVGMPPATFQWAIEDTILVSTEMGEKKLQFCII